MVAITAYNARGEAHDLPARSIPTSSPIRIDLAQELSSVAEDFGMGNLQCRYSGPADQLTGQVSIISLAERISFEAAMAMGAATSRLSSLISTQTDDSKGFVALTNLSIHELNVRYDGHDHEVIQLGARETRMIGLDDLTKAKVKPGKPGLITLQHDGAPGELSAVGIVFSDSGEGVPAVVEG